MCWCTKQNNSLLLCLEVRDFWFCNISFNFYISERKGSLCVVPQQSMQYHQSVNSEVDYKGLGWHLGQAHSNTKVSNVPKYK